MKATLEAASLVDALNAAVRIAPERGAHFEQCQGVLLEVEPNNALVTATNSDITWQRKFEQFDTNGRAAWRLSSMVAKFVGKLPIGDGAAITIEDIDGDRIRIASGTMRGEFSVLDAYAYPKFSYKMSDKTATVTNLADALKRVSFACDNAANDSVLNGVHLDGTMLTACNRHMAARVFCGAPIDKPLTAPLAPLASTLKRADEIQLGMVSGRLALQPDPDTLITSSIYEGVYPDVERLWDMTKPCDQRVEFDAAEALAVLDRILLLCKADQYPTCSVTFTEGAMVFDVNIPDLGRVTDEVACASSIDTSFEMKFSPRDLKPALFAAGGAVQWYYQRDAMKAVRLDAHEFSCVLMPKAK